MIIHSSAKAVRFAEVLRNLGSVARDLSKRGGFPSGLIGLRAPKIVLICHCICSVGELISNRLWQVRRENHNTEVKSSRGLNMIRQNAGLKLELLNS